MSFSEMVREQLKKKIGCCPTCGLGSLGLREHSKNIGLPLSTLWRITSGKNFDAKSLDKICAYLKIDIIISSEDNRKEAVK